MEDNFLGIWAIYERAFLAGAQAAGAAAGDAEEILEIARPSFERLYRGEDPGTIIFALVERLRAERDAARAERDKLLAMAAGPTTAQ